MPQSLARVWLHIVFSTKDRQTYLQRDAFRDEMFRMIGHHVGAVGCVPLRTGGWHDHVHLLCGLSRVVTIAALVEHVKVETSKWAKTAENGVARFAWQSGYGAFSVSPSKLDDVINYVETQPAHHAARSFQDEYRQLCRNHQIEIDERYVWD